MLAEKIIKRAREMGCTAEMEVRPVDKGNGVVLNAITVRNNGSNIGANVYYKDDDDVEVVAEQIVKVSEMGTPKCDLDILTDFDKAKEHLTVTLYSQLPEHVVGKQMIGDLYVVPTIVMGTDDNGDVATVKVTEQLLDKYGVELDELLDMAVENAKRITPASVRSMFDTIKDMIGADEDVLKDMIGQPQLLVVTNESKINGAGAILYAEGLPGEFYMLPSSRHEVLIVPMEMAGTEDDLKNMVRGVNATQVAPEDRLSDNAYYYNNGEWRVIA